MKLQALAIAALFLVSCSRSFVLPLRDVNSHALVLVLPSPPESWAGLPDLAMAVSWRDPDGRLRSTVTAPGSRISIEVERGHPQALIARPSSAGRTLSPAGALYPEALTRSRGSSYDDDRDALYLDWIGGYAASIALALWSGGVDPWCYDLYRLADAALERSGDPWLISPLEAARRLSSLEFRIDAYKTPELMQVKLPDPCPWAPESPFAAAGTQVSLLPEGLWRFLGAEASLLVSVDSEGGSVTIQY
jgi:hypothetical protein